MTTYDTTTTEGKAAVMLAHAGGAEIEYRGVNSTKWHDHEPPVWDWITWVYRIKPEPRVPREFYVVGENSSSGLGYRAYPAKYANPKRDPNGILCREVLDD